MHELLKLIAEVEEKLETAMMMKLSESSFDEWNDPEEDIYSDESSFSQTGLKKTSIIKTNKIATIHESIFQKRLGKLPPDLLTAVKKSLVKSLNL